MTPRELEAVMKGARARLRREHNDRAWLAWTITHLPGSRKKFSDLVHRDRPARARSWQDEFAGFAAWAQAAAR